MSQDNSLLVILLVKWLILTINQHEHQPDPLSSRQLETADMWLPHGSERQRKRCDWKRTYDETHYSRPLQDQAPLTAGIRFRGERKMESSLQHLSEAPSVHRGHVLPILWEVLAPGGNPVPVIGMNRSVHPVNLGEASGLHLKAFFFADLWWGFVLRGFVPCALRDLPPLHIPSPYELKRVQKSIPLALTPSFFIQRSAFHHIKL